MTNREKYRVFCEKETTIPIFSQAWWLDATCGDAWDVCLVEKGNEIVASMPYLIRKRYGFTILTQPQLTQSLGPWIRSSQTKYSTMLGQQKGLMYELIAQLPKYDHFAQDFHYSITNWLPFYWRGFEQTTRYTYVIDGLTDLDKAWDNFEAKIRRAIRKAKKLRLVIKCDLPISGFIKLNQMVFLRQNLSVPYSEDFIKQLSHEALKRQQCKWFIAQDNKGNNHAGVFIVWDESTAYYLMGGGDPNYRNSGATSLCMWKAIQCASTVTNKFDFEGSMIESVERFFRGFGAAQKPYFAVSKTNSRLIKTALCMRNLFKG